MHPHGPLLHEQLPLAEDLGKPNNFPNIFDGWLCSHLLNDPLFHSCTGRLFDLLRHDLHVGDLPNQIDGLHLRHFDGHLLLHLHDPLLHEQLLSNHLRDDLGNPKNFPNIFGDWLCSHLLKTLHLRHFDGHLLVHPHGPLLHEQLLLAEDLGKPNTFPNIFGDWLCSHLLNDHLFHLCNGRLFDLLRHGLLDQIDDLHLRHFDGRLLLHPPEALPQAQMGAPPSTNGDFDGTLLQADLRGRLRAPGPHPTHLFHQRVPLLEIHLNRMPSTNEAPLHLNVHLHRRHIPNVELLRELHRSPFATAKATTRRIDTQIAPKGA